MARLIRGAQAALASVLALSLGSMVPVAASASEPYFAPPFRSPLTVTMDSLAAGDVDQDGDLDVIGPAFKPGELFNFPRRLVVALNDGAGSFIQGQRIGPVKDTQYYSTPAVGDLDNDGDVDVATVSIKHSWVSVMLGQQGATFGTPVVHHLDEIPVFVTMGDVDGDDDLDLAVGQRGAIALFQYDGDGQIVEMARLGKTQWGSSIAFVDVDDDGDNDVVAYAAHHTVGVWLNAGSWTFGPRLDVTFPEEINGELTYADFDGDGFIDVAACSIPGDLAIAYGRGDGTFEPPQTIATLPSQQSIDSADLGGDGRAELTATETSRGQLTVYTVSADRTRIRATTHVIGGLNGAISCPKELPDPL